MSTTYRTLSKWEHNRSFLFKKMLKKFLLLFLIPAFAVADDVIDLSAYSPSDFKAELESYDVALVEFFAPWCGHCKRLAPEYTKAATELKSNDPPVPLVKVDCTSDLGKDTCQENGVQGYPTLKIFKNGEFAQEYQGPRDSDGIVKYMKAQAGPASKEYTSFAELKERLSKAKDVVVVGVFSSDSDALAKKFHKTAGKLRESATFAHVYTSSASDSVSVLNELVPEIVENSIVLVRPVILKNMFEASHVLYDDSESLDDFVKTNYHGLVGHRQQSNIADFNAPIVVAYFDVDYTKNVKGTNYWRNRVLKVAKEIGSKDLSYAISNNILFGGELEEFGVDSKSETPVVAARDKDNKKYIMKEKFSVEALKKFVEDFLAGNLQPFVKSEELPEDNSGPVKVAVGRNFDDLVLNSKKDVFIEFYAPWCGHCKKLAPIYEELGKALENEPTIEIVKMDATANDITGPFQVHGFPTLYFLPSTSKVPKKYEGGRDLDDFISYIAKYSTEELKGYTRDGKARKDEL